MRTVTRIPLAGPVPNANTVSRPVAVASDGRGRMYVTLIMWQTDPATKQKTELSTQAAIAVIDEATQAVVSYLPVGPLPRYIAADPVTGHVFVTHNALPEGDTVTVINGATAQPKVIKVLREGRNVLGVAINPLTRRVYVAQAVDARLTVLDADSLAVLGQITLENGIQLDRITLDTTTNRIYVPARRLADKPETPWLYVVDGTVHTWTKVSLAVDTPQLQGAPRSAAVDPATGTIYVAKFGSVNSVAVLDHSNPDEPPRLVTTIGGGGGGSAADIHFDATRNLAFVANSTSPGLAKIGLGISVLDGATNAFFTVPQHTPQQGKAPAGAWGLGVSAHSGLVYITNPEDTSLSVADVARLPRGTDAILSRGEGRWSEPRPLGGKARSAAVLVANGREQIDLFALDAEGALWRQHRDGEEWLAGESLGGALTGTPAVIARGAGRLEVFGVGADGTLWHRAQGGGAWGEWQSLGGALIGTPAVIARGAGRLEVFGVGADGALWRRAQDGGAWGEWQSLGGALAGSPTAIIAADGLHLFAVGVDHALWHRFQAHGQWAAWEALGGSLASAPTVIATDADRIEAFAIGTDGALWNRSRGGGRWGNWQSYLSASLAPAVLAGGTMPPAPIVLASGQERLDVLAVLGGVLQHIQRTRNQWSPPKALPFDADGGLAAHIHDERRLDVVVFGVSGGPQQHVYEHLSALQPLLRPADMLALEFELFNLQVQAGSPPKLVRIDPFNPDTYIVFHFEPQHIAEEAFFESDPTLQRISLDFKSELTNGGTVSPKLLAELVRCGVPVSSPAKITRTGNGTWLVSDGQVQGTLVEDSAAKIIKVNNNIVDELSSSEIGVRLAEMRLAGKSWLAFKVPPSVAEIPYTYAGLLDACRTLPMSLAPAAWPVQPKSAALPGPAFKREALERLKSLGAANTIVLPISGAGNNPSIRKPKSYPSPAEDPPFAPLPPYTAIEVPYRLVLSPDGAEPWRHRLDVVRRLDRKTNVEWVELWHTRLEPPHQLVSALRQNRGYLGATEPALAHLADGGVTLASFGSLSGEMLRLAIKRLAIAEPRLRAIWSPDYDSPDASLHTNKPFRMSLDAKDRDELVKLTTGLLPGASSRFAGSAPVYARRLMLSALGAWIDTHGSWNDKLIAKQDLSVQEWRHQATMGRDHYVRVVYAGYLFPFGHAASLVKITERKFEQPPDPRKPPVAYLRQRMYIVVREPERFFEETVLGKDLVRDDSEEVQDKPVDFSWQMPFKRVQIRTKVTPNLEDPLSSSVAVPVGKKEPWGQDLFWPRAHDAYFHFLLSAEDWAGQVVDFTAPLIFMSTAIPQDNDDHDEIPKLLKELATYYEENDHSKVLTGGQLVAFAPPLAPGDTTLAADSIRFGALIPTEEGKPRFYPVVREARAVVPAVAQLLGNHGQVEIVFNAVYKQHGMGGANAGNVFADLNNTLAADFTQGGAVRLGVATPDFTIQGLSRTHGPIGGKPDDFAKGAFAPSKVFNLPSARLLGGVALTELLSDNPAVLGGASDATADQFVNAPRVVTENLPSGTKTTLSWKPQVEPYDKDPVKLMLASLKITVTRMVPLDGGEPTYSTESTLEAVAITLFNAVTLKLDKLRFSVSGAGKPDVHAEMGSPPVEFLGALGFVADLARYIPTDGFSDPPFVDIVPSGSDAGITSGFTLALPNIAVGVLSLQNIAFLAALRLPFNGDPANLRVQFSSRHNPFLLTVGPFGGGGFFGLDLNFHGIHLLEASLEFGGSLALDIGVASGAVTAMAGIYFKLTDKVELSGFLRITGAMEVLGLVAISTEFYMELTYRQEGKVFGQATVSVEIDIAFFSKTVPLKVERQFAGSGGDPTFDQLVTEPHWNAYTDAFDNDDVD